MFRRLLDRGWLAIVGLFVVGAVALGSFLPRLVVDASTNLLLDEHDPDLTYYSQSRLHWPSDDEFAIFCCRRADWFTPESLALLREIQTDLAKVPHVKPKGGVLSLLEIPLLQQGMPRPIEGKGIDLAKAKAELLGHAVAKGTFIAESKDAAGRDGQDACLLVYLDAPAEHARLDRERTAAIVAGDHDLAAKLEAPLEIARAELRARRRALVDGIRDAAERWTPKLDGPVRLSGLPIINLNLIEFVSHDVDVFGIASFALFTLGFAVMYRRVRWTAFPILTCLLPVVLIVGAMAALELKLTVITANLPLLLFVLMLPYTVYFLERYRERRAADPSEPHGDTTARSAADVWVPCLYSCTTGMAGFASLLTSGVKPVRWFGLMMTIGMGVGLLCVFLFLPAATVRLPAIDDPRVKRDRKPTAVVRVLERLVLGAPAVTGLFGVVLYAAGAWGCTQLTVENKFIDYFKPTSEVYQGLEYIDRQMGGTTPADIVLTSEKKGFFRTPEGIAAIRAAGAWLEKEPDVGSVTSLATLVAEAQKAPLYSKMLPAGILMYAEGNPDLRKLLRDVATEDYQTARVLVRFRETSPTLNRKRILTELRADLASRPELAELSPRITGVFLLYSNMLETLLQSQKDTFWAVILAISLMLMTLFGIRRVWLQIPVAVTLAVVPFFFDTHAIGIAAGVAAITALVAAIAFRLDERLAARGFRGWSALVHTLALSVVVHVPEILPAVVVLGVMGWAGIPLDLITVTIAAISMGIGIDAAIQYTVRFRQELAATGGDRRAAVTRSHATIGRSIWIATSIMVLGFAVMAFSDFVPTIYFGLFNALAMVIGQFAALSVLPALFLMTGLPRHRPD